MTERLVSIETLLELLALHGGKIVSTASLAPEWINQARASGRMCVNENYLGFVWEPEIGFPTNEKEVEQFEEWFPLDVYAPEGLADRVFDAIEQNIKARGPHFPSPPTSSN